MIKGNYKKTVEGGHAFALDTRGEIDVWALDEEYHNGPRCVTCHTYFCEHCDRGLYEEICPLTEDLAIPGLEL